MVIPVYVAAVPMAPEPTPDTIATREEQSA